MIDYDGAHADLTLYGQAIIDAETGERINPDADIWWHADGRYTEGDPPREVLVLRSPDTLALALGRIQRGQRPEPEPDNPLERLAALALKHIAIPALRALNRALGWLRSRRAR